MLALERAIQQIGHVPYASWKDAVAQARTGNLRPMRAWVGVARRLGGTEFGALERALPEWPLQHTVPELWDSGRLFALNHCPSGIDLAPGRYVAALVAHPQTVEVWTGERSGAAHPVRWQRIPLCVPHPVVLTAAGECPACAEIFRAQLRCPVCIHGSEDLPRARTRELAGPLVQP